MQSKPWQRVPVFLFLIGAVLVITAVLLPSSAQADPQQMGGLPDIIFVARAHLATPDVIFGDELGPAGQWGTGIPKFAPGSRLVQRDTDGSLHVYTLPGLVDVQSPDVNFAATKIVFAGATTIDPNDTAYGWRLYEVDVGDFSGGSLTQLTFTDRTLTIPNAGQFGNSETYSDYHDLFPAYLADGRIVFNSSRYPTRSHYDHRASFNVYIMDGDGSNLRRITTERASVLHPTPLPDGRILVSRWWNQFNQPSERGIYNRIDDADVDVLLSDGTRILANPNAQFNPARAILPGGFEVRDAPNTWHLMTLNPDGTDFKRFAWTPCCFWSLTDDSGRGDTYAAAQPAVVINNQQLYVAYTMQPDQSMVHTTLESGIRVALPGVEMLYANAVDSLAGLTYEQAYSGDDSGPYALHPWGLPDGRILYAQSIEDNSLPGSGQYNGFDLQGSNLRYQLWTMNVDGSGQTLVPVDLAPSGLATADLMDAKPITPRVGWSTMPDVFLNMPSDDPINGNVPNTMPEYWFSQNGPNEIETATIHNPNVYANASLHTPYVNNSPPPGSVAKAQLWLDANQFTGAYCYNGWPQPCDDFRQDVQVRAVLWDEVDVTPAGAFTMTVPADTMGFIMLRDAQGRLVRRWDRGYSTIAQGSAWARPGETVTCVGCHMGHVSGSLDDVEADAESGWQNVAPYAAASASSHKPGDMYSNFGPEKIKDRRGWIPLPPDGSPAPFFDQDHQVGYQDDELGWMTEDVEPVGQWVELIWPISMRVKQIRLVGPPSEGGDWGGFGDPEMYGPYYVEEATLAMYLDGNLVDSQATGRIEPLDNGGTLLTFDTPLEIDRLRLTVQSVNGRWYWQEVAALNEIEVIGQATMSWPELELFYTWLPMIKK